MAIGFFSGMNNNILSKKSVVCQSKFVFVMERSELQRTIKFLTNNSRYHKMNGKSKS